MRARTIGGKPRRRGMVVVLVAVCLTAMLGVLAVVMDGGSLLAERTRVQAAADSAAAAATGYLIRNYSTDAGLDPSGKAKASAIAYATANGYANDSDSSVTVSIPPITGPNVGLAGYAEVSITSNPPRFFSALWGSGKLVVAGRAVSRGLPVPYSNASLICLDPSASPGLSVAGSAQVVCSTGIQVNSSSSNAANANNAAKISSTAINIVGGYTTSSSGSFNGTVQTGAASIPDPLATMAAPDPSTLTVQGSVPAYGSFTINPGIYNGGVTFGGGSNVTMNPGIYYMKGGTFTVANGVTISGSGVMIYSDNTGGSAGAINFQGGGRITLSPPTSGTYAGVVVYQDRASTKTISIANGTNTSISGTVYAAGARISYAGGANYNQSASQFICKTLDASNNAYVGIGWGAGTVARRRAVNLVE